MRSLLSAVVMAFWLLVSPAAAKSIALIIGNDTYENIDRLQKARADASGYNALFSQLGFDVTMRTDLSGRDMVFELATFFDRIEPGDTVVFVFAGHGWSDGAENYLVPTDIRISGSETLLARESFPLRNGVNGVIDEIAKRGARLTLAIIDACRNNPFEASDGTRTIGMSRGLVPVSAPTGTFVAFSAGAGQTALDRISDTDAVPYSVFTRHFLSELTKPQDLQSAFKQTQKLVNDEAGRIGHPQRPAYYDEVVGSACLTGQCDGVLTPAVGAATQPLLAIPAPVNPAPTPRDLQAEAAEAWGAFKDSNSVEALELFVKTYDGTAYAALARERIASLTKPAPQPALPAIAGPRPSWCPNAGTVTERAICANDRLAAFDIALGQSYAQLRRQLRGNNLAALKTSQRSWLQYRDSCGANGPCLENAYRTRLQQLGN